MPSYEKMLTYELAGNSAKDILMALVFFVGVVVVLRFCVHIVTGRLRAFAGKTESNVDDALVGIVEGVRGFFYIVAALYVASRFLVLPEIVSKILFGVFIVVVVYESIGILEKLLQYVILRFWLRDGGNESQVSAVLGLVIRIVLWSIGLILVLSNIGVNVSSLIASLGIGGIAVALALQNILSDMFSSFSIYVDQPFKVGDFIIVGDHMGTVKKIGLKTTRIQALQGEEIVISNAELTSARVRNFKQMQKRRIVFHIGVTYDTPKEKLEKIPSLVEAVIDPVENAECNRVHFREFADSSLNFEIVYYVQTGDYKEYMDIQQAINLGIVEVFEKEKIEMAFPTRTVHLVKE